MVSTETSYTTKSDMTEDKGMQKVTKKLKEMIDLNGLTYLMEEPYKVSQELLQGGEADRKTAGLIL